MDTTIGKRTTIFMVVLLAVMLLFYTMFAALDYVLKLISSHGPFPNIFFIAVMSKLLMKFKD